MFERMFFRWPNSRKFRMTVFPEGLFDDALTPQIKQPLVKHQETDNFDPTECAGSLGGCVPGIVVISRQDLLTSEEREEKIISSAEQSGKMVKVLGLVINNTIYQKTICLFIPEQESMVKHLEIPDKVIVLYRTST